MYEKPTYHKQTVVFNSNIFKTSQNAYFRCQGQFKAIINLKTILKILDQ